MAYPAALLLLNLSKYKAFKYFTNIIIGSEFVVDLFKFKVEKLQIYSNTFDVLLKE
jgi:hypothetical protein